VSDEDDAVNEAAATAKPDLLTDVLTRVFGRKPRGNAVDRFREKLDIPASKFLKMMEEAKAFGQNAQVGAHSPAGHYFSPVVDPAQIEDYYARSSTTSVDELRAGGIAIDIEGMNAFWKANRSFIAKSPWTNCADSGHRYFYDGGPYPRGDANTVRAMMNHFRPKRVIEVGSGFSSAAILDTAEELGLDAFTLTCIEPYPQRLKGQLRESDYARVEILEEGVQTVAIERFDALEAGDICFIDSTHVLKTGSDVHHELFRIIPRLKPGVMLHFHDCRFPLEYSRKQVFEKNYSWNEVYAVRALLMHSTKFRIFFWGSLFEKLNPQLVRNTLFEYARNPGSALWIETIA